MYGFRCDNCGWEFDADRGTVEASTFIHCPRCGLHVRTGLMPRRSQETGHQIDAGSVSPPVLERDEVLQKWLFRGLGATRDAIEEYEGWRRSSIPGERFADLIILCRTTTPTRYWVEYYSNASESDEGRHMTRQSSSPLFDSRGEAVNYYLKLAAAFAPERVRRALAKRLVGESAKDDA
jgi:DNA-directed RNA polymerase subunit RPC12/RpoP